MKVATLLACGCFNWGLDFKTEVMQGERILYSITHYKYLFVKIISFVVRFYLKHVELHLSLNDAVFEVEKKASATRSARKKREEVKERRLVVRIMKRKASVERMKKSKGTDTSKLLRKKRSLCTSCPC